MDLYDLKFISYLPKIQNQEYWNRYIDFLKSRLGKTIKGIPEQHHIIPKCYLPKYLSLEESFENNKILLSAHDHYKAHFYLAKALNDNSMLSAFKKMSSVSKYYSSLVFDENVDEVKLKQTHYKKSRPYKRYWKK